MNSEHLFDHSFRDGILNPTHGDGFHLFSDDFKKKFVQLVKEFEGNSFEVHDPIICDGNRSPPVLLEVSNGNRKNKRSMLADLKYDGEIVYAVPLKKEADDEYAIPDGIYYVDNVLILGIDICDEYTNDFMGMMKKALQDSDLEIIATKEWDDDYGNMRDLSLTVCDRNDHHWQILFS